MRDVIKADLEAVIADALDLGCVKTALRAVLAQD
jgi:hypothetical protein